MEKSNEILSGKLFVARNSIILHLENFAIFRRIMRPSNRICIKQKQKWDNQEAQTKVKKKK